MPLLEALVAALAIAWPILRAAGWHTKPRMAARFVGVTLACVTALLVAGGMRWPLAPLLALVLIWEVQAVGIMIGDIPPPGRSRSWVVRLVLLFFLIIVPAVLVPAILLPAVPTVTSSGPFPVGAMDTVLVDSDRDGAGRRLRVRLWYPAELDGRMGTIPRHPQPALLEQELGSALGLAGAPWMLRGISRGKLRTAASPRLSTRQRSYPAVILSHGLPGAAALLAELAMALASEGYVVMAPDHAGGSWGTAFDDGTTVPVQVTGLQAGSAELQHWLSVWEQDGRFLVDALHQMRAPTSGHFLSGRLLGEEIGWVGQGLGGVAGRSLATEGAFAAVVVLDPPAGLPAGGGQVPVLLLGRDPLRVGSGGVVTATMPGADLADFSDLARWSPLLLRRSAIGGRVPADRMATWIRQATLEFLERHLPNVPHS